MKGRVKKVFKFRTIMFLSLVLFSVSGAALTAFICYRDYSEALLDNYREARADVLYQVSEKTNQIYKSASLVSNSYYYADELDTIIEANEEYAKEHRQSFNGSMKSLDMAYRNMLANYYFDYYVVLHCMNDYNYISKNRYQDTYNFSFLYDMGYYDKIAEAEGRVCICGPYRDILDEKTEESVLIFGRLVYGTYRKERGYFLVCVPEKVISDEYSPVSENSFIYLVNSEKRIVSTNRKELLGSDYGQVFGNSQEDTISDGGTEYLVSSYYNPILGLTIVEHYPYEHILSAVSDVNFHVMVLCVLVIGAGIVLALLYAKIFSRQIQRLGDKVMLLDGNNLDIDFQCSGWQEIRQISNALEEMQARIRRLVDEIKEKERKKRKAEMDFLQMQINPHFIYNTVFCAKCLVDIGKSEDASHMLVDFIEYLRWMFKSVGERITVEETLRHLEQYISIMRYRYTDRFAVVYRIEEESRKAEMIHMLIQPIVENAILHGIEPCERVCHLRIAVRRVEEYLFLSIQDDGVGMDDGRLKLFRDQLSVNGRHHGMNNVLSRLGAAYGEDYKIEVHSRVGEGTEVILMIPFSVTDAPEAHSKMP